MLLCERFSVCSSVSIIKEGANDDAPANPMSFPQRFSVCSAVSIIKEGANDDAPADCILLSE